MRLWPRSLLGQTLLAVALALLVAQGLSAVLLYRAAENGRQNAILNAAALDLLVDPQTRPQRMPRRLEELGPPRRGALRGRRPLRMQSSQSAPLLPGETNRETHAARLAELLARQGVQPTQVQVVLRRAGSDPAVQERARRNPRFAATPEWAERQVLVAGIQLRPGDAWRVTRVPVPEREPRVIGGIVAQTLVMFAVLVGALYLLLRRITGPLAALTRRTAQFTRTQDAADPLDPAGPQDIYALIEAHNAMEARIAAMLDEKDIMLGAIGHDLKTPLAALRVRIESVSDDQQRDRMAASIDDIAHTLDDILSLARVGRATQDAEPVQIAALVESVVEEFEDMGQPVTIAASERIVHPVHVTWLRRALRNLIANALRYAGTAEVTLLRTHGVVVLRVDDNGPGIPADRIGAMLEPFQRGEASRNRKTGGAGLGLALSRAIAEQHGGTLVLANRNQGGLRAELRLPAA